MTANIEGDAFGRLPVELRIKILKLSPDPLSLRSLAHASPTMGRVLNRYPLEIVEVVLDATVPLETRRLMSAVLKARVSRLPASLSEAQRVARIDSPVVTDDMRSSIVDRAAAAVRYLLATAENVHAWSHVCLEHLIRKSMELRPSTLIKNGAGHTSRERFERAESRKDYVPQYTGSPSWVEGQRMIKAFWRLQLFLELQGAGNKGRLDTYWPGQEVDALSKSSPDGFYNVFDFEREQILTACDFFDAVTSGTITLVEAIYENTYGLPTIHWNEGAVSGCCCAEPPSFERNQDTFHQGPENLDKTQNSYHFHSVMSSDQWLDGRPPLLGLPFHPWRKYGFAIWDNKRMADLGMRDLSHKPFTRNYIAYSFRWFSILSEEDLP
ncbi:hypothetical protein COCMIDRAFT_106308 [Bipolaris oryzae ATCC 44560]|uniref:F-box domain-containing protein n=1 Tax=Bipolaris oryzae ATCC 44560 TaxID=930090 RepID=W6YV11_COCMI|nr:uncharacterized protein COCMIDRAFT_106308 [Bipolaris oryzae ATCC 44560]EUC41393.1 hypothetical protein COCMIDRAFT_106308 [Bipolaris oryzae ATCC 44560]